MHLVVTHLLKLHAFIVFVVLRCHLSMLASLVSLKPELLLFTYFAFWYFFQSSEQHSALQNSSGRHWWAPFSLKTSFVFKVALESGDVPSLASLQCSEQADFFSEPNLCERTVYLSSSCKDEDDVYERHFLRWLCSRWSLQRLSNSLHFITRIMTE